MRYKHTAPSVFCVSDNGVSEIIREGDLVEETWAGATADKNVIEVYRIDMDLPQPLSKLLVLYSINSVFHKQ